MKKILVILLAGLMVASVAMAQGTPEKGKPITYPQLADLMVKALGLVRFLPTAPTAQQKFDILTQNGISPAEGWTLDEDTPVTKGDLSRVLIQAMQREDEVENPLDSKSWLTALKEMGISLSSVSETLQSVEVLPEPVAQNVGRYSTDPLVSDRQAQLTGAQYTVELDTALRVLSEMEQVLGEFRPIGPTPH